MGVKGGTVASRSATDNYDVVHLEETLRVAYLRGPSLVGGRVFKETVRLTWPGMPTRFLIIASLITALVILVGVGLWFLLGVL